MTGPADATLDELERDALTELVNIGVSRAAVALRQMVGRPVLLSVPSIEVMSQRSAAALVSEREHEELVAIRQDFAGPFRGRALLIFSQTNSVELVRAVIGGEPADGEVASLAQEALAETGNIILNSCLGTIANILRQSLDMTLPEVLRGNGMQLFEPIDTQTVGDVPTAAGAAPDGSRLVLFLYINFSVLDRDIRGYIAMLMDLPSMAVLRLLVRDFIATVLDDDVAPSA